MKTYYKYEQNGPPMGVIGSNNSNIILCNKIAVGLSKREFSKCVICAALENVVVWNLSNSEIILLLNGDKYIVTKLAFHISNQIAAGYSDGDIRIWNTIENDAPLVLKGHTSSVSALDFDRESSRLVSGSVDNYIIIWDVINECGLYRLKGHSGSITCCRFMCTANILISSSKDTFIKLWDLDTQHCFATLLGHDSEVWDFVTFNDETGLVAATSNDELKVWSLIPSSHADSKKRSHLLESASKNIPISCRMLGSIIKKTRGRTRALIFDSCSQLLFCLSKNYAVEVFKISNTCHTYFNFCNEDENNHFSFGEFYGHVGIIDGLNISSFDVVSISQTKLNLCFLDKNNIIELYELCIDKSNFLKNKKISNISHFGHRSHPVCVKFNSNALFFSSGSKSEIKIWSVKNKSCIRTIQVENCISLLYLQGDRYLVAGMKSGNIHLLDAANGETLNAVDAHSGAVLDLKLMPVEEGFASAGSDKTVKFWNYETKGARINIVHVRTLEMDEDVLCVCYSFDQKFIAAALIDGTVKIFFNDTLKFYITLYGHKLPVNSVDFSYDNELIITASGDKNIKIWGLGFGDCRKSLFGHSASINCVRFVNKSHNFFSCSDDGVIKYWDGSAFQCIMEIKGHHDKILQFDLCSEGDMLVSVSNDFSIRFWERVDELFAPNLEIEDEDVNVPTEAITMRVDLEVLTPWKLTVESLKITENLVDALDIFEGEEIKSPNSDPHPILQQMNLSPRFYVLYVLKKTPSNDLDLTLTILPFKYVLKFLQLIQFWLESSLEIELCCRCMTFLIKLHFYQFCNSANAIELIDDLSKVSMEKLKHVKSNMGYNLSTMGHLKNHIESENKISIYDDVMSRLKKN